MEVRLEEEYIKHKKKETEPKEDQSKNIMIKTKLSAKNLLRSLSRSLKNNHIFIGLKDKASEMTHWT